MNLNKYTISEQQYNKLQKALNVLNSVAVDVRDLGPEYYGELSEIKLAVFYIRGLTEDYDLKINLPVKLNCAISTESDLNCVDIVIDHNIVKIKSGEYLIEGVITEIVDESLMRFNVTQTNYKRIHKETLSLSGVFDYNTQTKERKLIGVDIESYAGYKLRITNSNFDKYNSIFADIYGKDGDPEK